MLRVIFIILSMLWTICSSIKGHAELSEGNFESGGHQFHFEGISTFQYPFLRLGPEPLLLITHSSVYWDRGHVTWAGIEDLVHFFRDRGLPLKYMAAIEERSFNNDTALKLANLYFPPGITSDDIYPYQGDSHRIITLGLDNASFLRYLKAQYFNEDTLLCKDPSLYALDRQFSYHIYRQGQWIGDEGQGSTRVILHFEDTKETLRQLSF